MPYVGTEDWQPVDIVDLEANAWRALRRDGSTLVIAGPGAGKTEFLAQRAAYLLQTGLCPSARRILAISFKRDAAENLARRVQARCNEGQSRRFDSVTFDAFTKGLVDRFSKSLPPAWQVRRSYGDLYFPRRDEIEEFLTETRTDAPAEWKTAVATLRASDFEARIVGRHRLPVEGIHPSDGVEFAVNRWWRARLSGERPTLTFTCLNRLAELLIRANPQFRRALLLTYPFVFVDEFQDTTYAQYDLLVSLFGGTDTRLTAVGDDKQRIMAWAGAREDAFSQLEADLGACRIPLTLNHRSSPGLVQVQQVIAKAIDSGAADVTSTAQPAIDGQAAEIWNFGTEVSEAETVASWLRADMDERGTAPRDYAILVRQRADRFEVQFEEAFGHQGIRIRNESRNLGRITLQDLLSEEVTRLGLALLRLGASTQAPDSWGIAIDAMVYLRGVGPEDELASRRTADELSSYVAQLRREMVNPPTVDIAEAIGKELFGFLDPQALQQSYPEYATGEGLAIAIEAFLTHLKHSAEGASTWRDCIERFEGSDATPLMTVHKSKGLEYDTILFVGLDDQSWWSHRAGDIEGLSTFFVALSRAKQRAIFTYCRERRRDRVADLYELLNGAGVHETVH